MLYDCVPSKTLIATSEKVTALRDAPALGVCSGRPTSACSWPWSTSGCSALAANQSGRHPRPAAARRASRLIAGRGRFAADQRGRTFAIEVADAAGRAGTVEADVVLLATGGTPRVLAGAEPDGERILSWRDIYDLTELPEHLIVVGSGVTGAEFASAYSEMGVPVTLVSSREKVLPGEDPDAADVIEKVFTEHGGTLMKQARAAVGDPRPATRSRCA